VRLRVCVGAGGTSRLPGQAACSCRCLAGSSCTATACRGSGPPVRTLRRRKLPASRDDGGGTCRIVATTLKECHSHGVVIGISEETPLYMFLCYCTVKNSFCGWNLPEPERVAE
jgi:hypothetical protein